MCGVGIEFRFWENKLLPAIRQQTFLWQIESRLKPIQIPSPTQFGGRVVCVGVAMDRAKV